MFHAFGKEQEAVSVAFAHSVSPQYFGPCKVMCTDPGIEVTHQEKFVFPGDFAYTLVELAVEGLFGAVIIGHGGCLCTNDSHITV